MVEHWFGRIGTNWRFLVWIPANFKLLFSEPVIVQIAHLEKNSWKYYELMRSLVGLQNHRDTRDTRSFLLQVPECHLFYFWVVQFWQKMFKLGKMKIRQLLAPPTFLPENSSKRFAKREREREREWERENEWGTKQKWVVRVSSACVCVCVLVCTRAFVCVCERERETRWRWMIFESLRMWSILQ